MAGREPAPYNPIGGLQFLGDEQVACLPGQHRLNKQRGLTPGQKDVKVHERLIDAFSCDRVREIEDFSRHILAAEQVDVLQGDVFLVGVGVVQEDHGQLIHNVGHGQFTARDEGIGGLPRDAIAFAMAEP